MLALGQPKHEYSARGTVRNAQTGNPTQDVRVSIAMMPTASQINDPFSGVPWDPHTQEVLSGPGGGFRFEGLPAGLYVCEAQKPGFVLYRGSLTLSEASPDAAVQLDLIPEPPVFKVRGKVQGYLAPEAVTLELLGGIHRTDPSRTPFDAHTGEFTILDVAPGEYRLRARQEKMRGEVKVSVGSIDVSGVSVALLLPRTVLGAMRSVGGRSDAIRYQNPCIVNLSQDWPPRPGAVYVPRWQQDGQFTLFTLEQQDGPFILEGVLLQALSGGVRVHIEDGEIAELTITGSSSTPTVRRVPFH